MVNIEIIRGKERNWAPADPDRSLEQDVTWKNRNGEVSYVDQMDEKHCWNVFHFLVRWAEKFKENEVELLEEEIRVRRGVGASIVSQENRLKKIKEMSPEVYVRSSPLGKRLVKRAKMLMKGRKELRALERNS